MAYPTTVLPVRLRPWQRFLARLEQALDEGWKPVDASRNQAERQAPSGARVRTSECAGLNLQFRDDTRGP